jgi:hypothetical protein
VSTGATLHLQTFSGLLCVTRQHENGKYFPMPSETQRIFIIELYWHLIHHGHRTFVSYTSHMSVPQMVVPVASEKWRCFRLPVGCGLKIMHSGFLRMAGLWILEDMYFLITSCMFVFTRMTSWGWRNCTSACLLPHNGLLNRLSIGQNLLWTVMDAWVMHLESCTMQRQRRMVARLLSRAMLVFMFGILEKSGLLSIALV